MTAIRLCLLLAFLIPGAALGQTVVEPDAYRMDRYRSAVPQTLKGGTVIGSDAAYALWKTGRVAFVDVLPRPPRPKELPAGTFWREKRRNSIPGSIWLPNVGYGKLSAEARDYFKAGLNKATSGDRHHPVVLFCLKDCWMSWNAAKRAIEYGFTNVFWYPEGTDGWQSRQYPLKELKAEPRE